MKKLLLMCALCLFVFAGAALAAEVHDWRDLRDAHEKIQQVIGDLEHVQRANHYDMGGHAMRAEKLLREAEHEMREAIEDAKRR